jgi:type III pantothenate kinase
MKILIDIGNTRIKWAVADAKDTILMAFTTKTRPAPESIRKALARCSVHGRVGGVAVAGVVPDVTDHIVEHAEQAFKKIKPVVLDLAAFKKLMPVKVKPVIPPGTDRLANAYAIFRISPLPACSVDAGSAVTVEVVDSRGRFIGGTIAPGEQLQLSALHSETSELHRVPPLPRKTPAIGQDTAAAMAAGIRTSIAWGVYGILQEINGELQVPLKHIVVTGGSGRRIYTFLKRKFNSVIYDKDLTLRGILYAYKALR